MKKLKVENWNETLQCKIFFSFTKYSVLPNTQFYFFQGSVLVLKILLVHVSSVKINVRIIYILKLKLIFCIGREVFD